MPFPSGDPSARVSRGWWQAEEGWAPICVEMAGMGPPVREPSKTNTNACFRGVVILVVVSTLQRKKIKGRTFVRLHHDRFAFLSHSSGQLMGGDGGSGQKPSKTSIHPRFQWLWSKLVTEEHKKQRVPLYTHTFL